MSGMGKECLSCGEDNLDSAVVCANCGGTLDDAADACAPEENRSECTWKIRCPVCGHEYIVADGYARIDRCAYCEDEIDKEAIVNVRPAQFRGETDPVRTDGQMVQTSQKTRPVLVLTELKSGKAVRAADSGVIGRSGNIEPEFFADDLYISEYHCRAILENNEWKIEHLSTMNPTKVNGIKMSPNVRNVVRTGDYLTIADKLFEVVIQQEAAGEEGAAEDAGKAVRAPKWVIICPKCGRNYEVKDESDRISECERCDEFDRHEIASTGAVKRDAD